MALLLLLDALLCDVVVSLLPDLFIVETFVEGWQKDVLRSDVAPLVVQFQLLNLVRLELPTAIFAHVVLDRVVNLLERLLLVPAFVVVLVDDSLHVFESLFLPLLNLPCQLRPGPRAYVLRFHHRHLGWEA